MFKHGRIIEMDYKPLSHFSLPVITIYLFYCFYFVVATLKFDVKQISVLIEVIVIIFQLNFASVSFFAVGEYFCPKEFFKQSPLGDITYFSCIFACLLRY